MSRALEMHPRNSEREDLMVSSVRYLYFFKTEEMYEAFKLTWEFLTVSVS